jgi:hypothetical protein
LVSDSLFVVALEAPKTFDELAIAIKTLGKEWGLTVRKLKDTN